MSVNWSEIPTKLEARFIGVEGRLAIINKNNGKSLTPQQIIDAYNTVTTELAKLLVDKIK